MARDSEVGKAKVCEKGRKVRRQERRKMTPGLFCLPFSFLPSFFKGANEGRKGGRGKG
jgi:hypothetical protein